jgi:site-specific recombinase XerD
VFPTGQGRRLSRDALEQRLTKHAAAAAHGCLSLATKRVTPHMLRHTAAMRLLQAGIDTTVIALWLGHEQVETTQIYLQCHRPRDQRKGSSENHTARWQARPLQAPDPLLAFLEAL